MVVVIRDRVHPEIDVRPVRLIACGKAKLTAVLRARFSHSVRALPCSGRARRPVAAHRRQVALVPVALNVPFYIDPMPKAGGNTHNWRRQNKFLDLCTWLRRPVDIDGVRRIDAADLENTLAPTDDLVPDADSRLLVTDTELLADPKIEQPSLEANIAAGIRCKPATDIGRRSGKRVLSAGCSSSARARVVVHPGAAGHDREPLRRHFQQQLVATLEVRRKGIAFVVVDVALVAKAADLPETPTARAGPGGWVISRRHEVFALRCRANTNPRGDCRIEAPLDRVVRERKGVRPRATQRDER
ncbi:hypothetical protein R82526_02579 [Ralstonia mannitolilytica]|nr:hypothetical protein R82526_02579 [Ralstonia mannitolilytica]